MFNTRNWVPLGLVVAAFVIFCSAKLGPDYFVFFG